MKIEFHNALKFWLERNKLQRLDANVKVHGSKK